MLLAKGKLAITSPIIISLVMVIGWPGIILNSSVLDSGSSSRSFWIFCDIGAGSSPKQQPKKAARGCGLSPKPGSGWEWLEP